MDIPWWFWPIFRGARGRFEKNTNTPRERKSLKMPGFGSIIGGTILWIIVDVMEFFFVGFICVLLKIPMFIIIILYILCVIAQAFGVAEDGNVPIAPILAAIIVFVVAGRFYKP